MKKWIFEVLICVGKTILQFNEHSQDSIIMQQWIEICYISGEKLKRLIKWMKNDFTDGSFNKYSMANWN